jgi:hypothetical protein
MFHCGEVFSGFSRVQGFKSFGVIVALKVGVQRTAVLIPLLKERLLSSLGGGLSFVGRCSLGSRFTAAGGAL